MKPINILFAAVVSCMAISLVLGTAGSLLHSRALEKAAVLSVAVGFGISLLPLAAAVIYSTSAWLRGKRPGRK